MEYTGQVYQDKFIASVLNNKTDGYFLELGANHYKKLSNTYSLEKHLNWKGIMVDCVESFLPFYQLTRTNSIPVINDATQINYLELLNQNNFPKNMDYLQIDLNVTDRTNLTTLEILSRDVFPEYKFATITFNHDAYTTDWDNLVEFKNTIIETREQSRNILNNFGYILVFPDVKNGENSFEDWYIHPDLVNMEYVNKIKTDQSLIFTEIMEILELNK